MKVNTKSALRRSLLALRLSLEDSQRKLWDRQICHHIERYLEKQKISTLGVYFSIRNEPDLTILYEAVSPKGMMLSLPVVVHKDAPLQFARWQPGDSLTKESYSIPVPRQKEMVPLPEAVLIPCLGFSRDRYRLGYGGGYFDRTLEQKPRPHIIGVAYSCLQTDFFVEKYDIPMDCIVTEQGIA